MLKYVCSPYVKKQRTPPMIHLHEIFHVGIFLIILLFTTSYAFSKEATGTIKATVVNPTNVATLDFDSKTVCVGENCHTVPPDRVKRQICNTGTQSKSRECFDLPADQPQMTERRLQASR